MEFDFTIEDVFKTGRSSKEDLEAVKTWKQLDERVPDIPDELLVLFLLSCDNMKLRTHETIHAYFKSKHAMPELCDNKDVDFPAIQRNIEIMQLLTFPVRTDDNNAIFFCRLTDPTYSKFDLVTQLKRSIMCCDCLMHENPPHGILAIVDIEQFGFRLLPKISASLLSKFAAYMQEGLPFKVAGIHMINCSIVAKPLMKLMQLCMKSALFNQLTIHYKGFNKEEFFKNHVPARCMPSDYGGELPSLEELHRQSVKRLRNLKQFLFEEEKIRKMYKY